MCHQSGSRKFVEFTLWSKKRKNTAVHLLRRCFVDNKRTFSLRGKTFFLEFYGRDRERTSSDRSRMTCMQVYSHTPHTYTFSRVCVCVCAFRRISICIILTRNIQGACSNPFSTHTRTHTHTYNHARVTPAHMRHHRTAQNLWPRHADSAAKRVCL